MRYAFALTLTLLACACQRAPDTSSRTAPGTASALPPGAGSATAASAPVLGVAVAPVPAGPYKAAGGKTARNGGASAAMEPGGRPAALRGSALGNALHPADPCYGLADRALADCLDLDNSRADDSESAAFRAEQARRDRDLLEQDGREAAEIYDQPPVPEDTVFDDQQLPPDEQDLPPYYQDLPPGEQAPPEDDYYNR